jgi:hypothetical protein
MGIKDTMKLFNINLEKFAENRFNNLLTVTILLFIFSPFLQTKDASQFLIVSPFIYSVAIIAILKTIVTDKKRFYIYCGIKLAVLLLDVCVYYEIINVFAEIIYIFSLIVRLVFFILFVLYLIKELFSTQKITSDTIKGGVCVYVLFGFAWTMIYKIVYMFNPASFSLQFREHWSFVYFSFTTLTTIGYGDITPVSSFARMLTSLEGMTGQLFLAIFIARLVGLHIINKSQE